MNSAIYLLIVTIRFSEVECKLYDIFENVLEKAEGEFSEIVHYNFSHLRDYMILPGTKWCGHGNKASTENDLGTFKETDKCCRAHDECPDTIKPHEKKFNLTNTHPDTRLSCECDEELKKCLKKANENAAKLTGLIYFEALGYQCFKKEYPIIKCKEMKSIQFTSYFKILKKCKMYELDKTKEKKYQFFDVPDW